MMSNIFHSVKVMTKIGAVCLITIGLWIVIELAVQFGGYEHTCSVGAGETETSSWHEFAFAPFH
jgi:H+-transporting ATPase